MKPRGLTADDRCYYLAGLDRGNYSIAVIRSQSKLFGPPDLASRRALQDPAALVFQTLRPLISSALERRSKAYAVKSLQKSNPATPSPSGTGLLEKTLNREEEVKKRASEGVRFMSIATAVLVGALILIVGQVSAEILAGTTNPNPQIFGCGAFTIDVNGAATGTNLVFTLPASTGSRSFSVLFNGECSVAATDDSTWLDIDVELLDPSIGSVVGALPPTTGSDNAFCTSTGDGALEHWVSASRNTFAELPAGPAMNLEIRVRGTLPGCIAGKRWRIDDISTIVMR